MKMRSRDKVIKQWVEGQASKLQVGNRLVHMIFLCASSLLLGLRRRDFARQDAQVNVVEDTKAVVW